MADDLVREERREYEFWRLHYASMGKDELFDLKYLGGHSTFEDYHRHYANAQLTIPDPSEELHEYRQELING